MRYVPTCFVRLLQYWYAHQTMQVKWGNCLSKSFLVTIKWFAARRYAKPRGGVEDTRLEAKAKAKIFQARSSQKFFKRSPQKNVFQKIFQALHKILIQKIVLSSSRWQANFRGLEASRPRPRTWNSRPRASKCVLEDSTSAKPIPICHLYLRSVGET